MKSRERLSKPELGDFGMMGRNRGAGTSGGEHLDWSVASGVAHRLTCHGVKDIVTGVERDVHVANVICRQVLKLRSHNR